MSKRTKGPEAIRSIAAGATHNKICEPKQKMNESKNRPADLNILAEQELSQDWVIPEIACGLWISCHAPAFAELTSIGLSDSSPIAGARIKNNLLIEVASDSIKEVAKFTARLLDSLKLGRHPIRIICDSGSPESVPDYELAISVVQKLLADPALAEQIAASIVFCDWDQSAEDIRRGFEMPDDMHMLACVAQKSVKNPDVEFRGLSPEAAVNMHAAFENWMVGRDTVYGPGWTEKLPFERMLTWVGCLTTFGPPRWREHAQQIIDAVDQIRGKSNVESAGAQLSIEDACAASARTQSSSAQQQLFAVDDEGNGVPQLPRAVWIVFDEPTYQLLESTAASAGVLSHANARLKAGLLTRGSERSLAALIDNAHKYLPVHVVLNTDSPASLNQYKAFVNAASRILGQDLYDATVHRHDWAQSEKLIVDMFLAADTDTLTRASSRLVAARSPETQFFRPTCYPTPQTVAAGIELDQRPVATWLVTSAHAYTVLKNLGKTPPIYVSHANGLAKERVTRQLLKQVSLINLSAERMAQLLTGKTAARLIYDSSDSESLALLARIAGFIDNPRYKVVKPVEADWAKSEQGIRTAFLKFDGDFENTLALSKATAKLAQSRPLQDYSKSRATVDRRAAEQVSLVLLVHANSKENSPYQAGD